MKYQKIVKAKFIERENRFVAKALVDAEKNFCGTPVKVHVKNTGRCKELLVPGATVYIEDFAGRMGDRKMRYSLVAVEKQIAAGKGEKENHETLLINMDSQAPNKVVHEALLSGRLKLPGFESEGAHLLVKPEVIYDSSRFDFYVEAIEKNGRPINQKAFIEVKGVTLEDGGFARFPDAPTQRGLKHIEELIKAAEEGYGAYIVFVIQMKKIHTFGPNYETHPEFGKALRKAAEKGVQVLAYDCIVTEDGLKLDKPVKIDLS